MRQPLLPHYEDFPYTLRVVSEILESNGSSSMATVCGGSLALMDAGVPMIRPVAGISIGLCTDQDDQDRISRYKLLTDIIGWEDAFCDMDCKIAGTEKGITGFQLDLKLPGVSHKIIVEAIHEAKRLRTQILEVMHAGLGDPKYRPCPLLRKYVAAGWLGKKSGRGFYAY